MWQREESEKFSLSREQVELHLKLSRNKTEALVTSKRLKFLQDNRTDTGAPIIDTNFVAPLRMHFQSSKGTLDCLKVFQCIQEETFVGPVPLSCGIMAYPKRKRETYTVFMRENLVVTSVYAHLNTRTGREVLSGLCRDGGGETNTCSSPRGSIMPKIMLEKQHYARLILAIFDALFYACRQKQYPHKSEKQYRIASITNLQEINDK